LHINGEKMNIVILGSTGSIGQQTVDIIHNFPDRFKVLGIAGGENTDLLSAQAASLQPEYIYSESEKGLPGTACVISMEEMASLPAADLVVVATSGKAGLGPTFAAIKAGKRIALANKEVLVMAGGLVMSEAQRCKAVILPVDSEHSAIWQCLHGETAGIHRLLLTASGGPFYRYQQEELARVTVADALNHPTWKMGKKVTIDSATLMNKGLEAIEAHWLFSIPFESIEIIIHPQSIIHSMIEFTDGSVKAQLSMPDMHLPIQYALTYPERWSNTGFRRLDLNEVSQLTFKPVQLSAFPCLELALEAGNKGDTYPAVLCAADEVAVDLFLNNFIKFTSIATIVKETLNLHQAIAGPSLNDIIGADEWARKTAGEVFQKRKEWL
jgi:1-deoxy-D-xylulose-5-phosphate reductoisomerase